MGGLKNSGTTRHGQLTKILSDDGIEMKDAARIRSGAVDPSVTAVDAPAASIYMSSATGKLYRKSDAGLTTNWQLLNFSEFTNDPTGFINEETIVVTYDGPNRQFSLYNTATPTKIEFLLLGKYYTYPASVGVPWIVPTVLGGATPIQHTNADGTYYLRVSGGKGGYTLGQVVFDIVPQQFTDLQIAVAFKNATAQFGMRECHNFMPHEDHEEFHYTNGCYLRAAAVLTGYTLPSTNTAQNMIAVAQITVYDEDLSTSILATPAAVWNVNTYTSGAYTIAYHAGPAGLINFYSTAQVPYISNAAAPATADATPINYTSLVAGAGTLTDVAEDSYVNIFTLALPVTADAESQKYRRIFFTGQRTFTTLAAAQLEVPSQVDFGQLRTALPEMVVTSMISYRKNALGVGAVASSMGQCMLDATATPVVFTGTKNFLVGVTGVSPSDHQSLSNRNATGATVADCTHPSYAISTEGVTWTAGGVLSAAELTVQAALDKLSSTFAGAAAVGLVSAGVQTFGGAKTFAALLSCTLGLAVTGGVAAAGTLSRATTIWNLGNALTIDETGCVIDRVAGGDIAIGGPAAVATSITLGKASATTCTTSVVDTTEATVGGAGALKVSGGIYVTKALFGGSTGNFATSVNTPIVNMTARYPRLTLSPRAPNTSWTAGDFDLIGGVNATRSGDGDNLFFDIPTGKSYLFAINSAAVGSCAAGAWLFNTSIQSPTLYGATATNGRLTLRGNVADTTTGGVDVSSSLEATVGGAGSFTVAGGAYITKALFGGSTAQFVTSVTSQKYKAGDGTTGADAKVYFDCGAAGLWALGVDKDSNTLWKLAYNGSGDFESGVSILVRTATGNLGGRVELGTGLLTPYVYGLDTSATNLNLQANAANTTTGAVAILTSTEATVGGAGALTVAGGIYVTKALFGGSTAQFVTSVSTPQITIAGTNPLGRINYESAISTDKVLIMHTITGAVNYGIGVNAANLMTIGILGGVDTWSVQAINIASNGVVTFPVNSTHTIGNVTDDTATILNIKTKTSGTSYAITSWALGTARAGLIGVSGTAGQLITGAAAGDLNIYSDANMYFHAGGTASVNHGSCVAGAWTLGPSTGATTTIIGATTAIALQIKNGTGGTVCDFINTENAGITADVYEGTSGRSFKHRTMIAGVIADIGGHDTAGAWTLGAVDSGVTAAHTIRGGGGTDKYTLLNITCAGTGGHAYSRFINSNSKIGYFGMSGRTNGIITGSAANDLCIAVTDGNILFSGNDGGTIHGRMTTAGAWTLGPTNSIGFTMLPSGVAYNNTVFIGANCYGGAGREGRALTTNTGVSITLQGGATDGTGGIYFDRNIDGAATNAVAQTIATFLDTGACKIGLDHATNSTNGLDQLISGQNIMLATWNTGGVLGGIRVTSSAYQFPFIGWNGKYKSGGAPAVFSRDFNNTVALMCFGDDGIATANTAWGLHVAAAAATDLTLSAASLVMSCTTTQGVIFSKAISLRETGGGLDLITIQAPASSVAWTLTLPADDGAANDVLHTDGSGVCSWSAAGAGDITNGGNTGAVTIGTNDATALNFETTNVTRVTIAAGGAMTVTGFTGAPAITIVGFATQTAFSVTGTTSASGVLATATTALGAVRGEATTGHGISGTATTGKGVLGDCTGAGYGVYASNTSGTGSALYVSGPGRFSELAGLGASIDVYADNSGLLYNGSDSRLKQEMKEHIPGLKEVNQLRVVAYKWKSDIAVRGKNAVTEIGFFADETVNVIASSGPLGKDGFYGFCSKPILGACVKSIQELTVEKEELKARIIELERRIAA